MKKLLVILVLVAVVGTGAMAQDFAALEIAFGNFAEGLASALPFASTIGLNWSDSYIGKLLHMGAGATIGVVNLPQTGFAEVIDALNIPGLRDKTWIPWPPPEDAGLAPPFSGERGSVVKLYSGALADGRAAILHPDVGEGLQFEFDTENLPHLGVLIQQGYYPDETSPFKGQLYLGLEPTTGVGDDLPTCASTNTTKKILPGREVRFWIRMGLLDL